MHGLIFETSIWLLAGSTRLHDIGNTNFNSKIKVNESLERSTKNVNTTIKKIASQTLSLIRWKYFDTVYCFKETVHIKIFCKDCVEWQTVVAWCNNNCLNRITSCTECDSTFGLSWSAHLKCCTQLFRLINSSIFWIDVVKKFNTKDSNSIFKSHIFQNFISEEILTAAWNSVTR